MQYATYTYKDYSIQKERVEFQNTRVDQYIISCNKTRKQKTRNSEFSQVLSAGREYWTHPEKDRRDYQRQRLYKSENKAFHKKEFETKFKDHAQAARFIAKVLKSNWFIQHFPTQTVVVKTTLRNDICARGKSAAYATSEISRIKIPNWALRNWVILHELAHTLTVYNYGSAHGRRFCFIYLHLVEKFMGKEAKKALEQEFKKNGVDYWKFGNSAEHLQDDYCPF